MQIPTLSECVDAVVPIWGTTSDDYLKQLRGECAPAVRVLQADRVITWYCFLLHNRATAGREDLPADFAEVFIHFRFSPAKGVTRQDLIRRLGTPFLHPVAKALGPIAGINVDLVPGGWADAWLMIGEASEWVLKMTEVHSTDLGNPVPQTLQFLHFITNGLGIGGRSRFALGSFEQRF